MCQINARLIYFSFFSQGFSSKKEITGTQTTYIRQVNFIFLASTLYHKQWTKKMWISVFMSHLFTPRIKLEITVVSWPHTATMIVWIGLPLCINSFPRKLPNECWPICCPKSITRKANTVENNILWVLMNCRL